MPRCLCVCPIWLRTCVILSFATFVLLAAPATLRLFGSRLRRPRLVDDGSLLGGGCGGLRRDRFGVTGGSRRQRTSRRATAQPCVHGLWVLTLRGRAPREPSARSGNVLRPAELLPSTVAFIVFVGWRPALGEDVRGCLRARGQRGRRHGDDAGPLAGGAENDPRRRTHRRCRVYRLAFFGTVKSFFFASSTPSRSQAALPALPVPTPTRRPRPRSRREP